MSATISDQIMEQLKTAMREKDTTASTVLRALKSAIKYAAIEKYGADGDLDEAEATAVVRKQIKQRQDSIESYRSANREDLAAREEAEIVILERFLPQPLGAEELSALVADVVRETGATSRKDMGNVMKILNERAAGRVDGKTLSSEVMKHLS